jgi:ADP-heptose:LPS heptosyltransferase
MRFKALEKGGKKAVLALLGALLQARPLDRKNLVNRRLQRVLVVRQDERLGNLILITPFLQALRHHLPRAHLVALVSSRFASVLHGNPDVDEIIPFEKRMFIRNPLHFTMFLRNLRRKAFDLAIDCGPVDGLSLNNALMTYLSGAPVRLGYLRGQSHLFLNLLVPRAREARSEIDYHLDLLRFCFGGSHNGRMKICLTPQEKEGVALRQRDWGLKEGELLVGVHVGGRDQKRWPAERFAQLAQRLVQDHGAKVVLFWGPGEHSMIRQFENKPQRGLLIAPPLEIRELAGHLQNCAVFISGDTGPMHLAQAVGTPTIAIFRVANLQRYGHRGPHHRIVFRPDGNVPVGDVLTAFRDLLKVITRESGDPGGC